MTRELSDQAKAMLERALAEEPLPNAQRRARLKRSLLQGAVAAGAGKAAAAPLAAGLAAPGAATSSAVALLPLAKGIGMGLLLTAGAVGGARVFSSTAAAPSPAPSAVAAPARAVDAAPIAPPLSPQPAASSAARADEPTVAVATSPRAPSSAGSTSAEPAAGLTTGLAAELQLLTAAQTALRDGQGAAALALLERYDRAFPGGQLLGERLAAEVFAACQLGNRARAVRAAERFLQRDGSSVLAGRVRRSCAFESGGNQP